jgi:phospholipase/carboxylesterase
MDDLSSPATELTIVAGPSADTARASVVLLHGYGRYPGQVLDMWPDTGCAVLAAQAGFRIGPGAYRWFDYQDLADGTVMIDRDEERCSRDALVRLLGAIDRPVYLVGHSQGGMMALSVLLLRPDLIDGCAVLNARILPEALAGQPDIVAIDGVPVFVGHSVGDTVVPVHKGRRTRESLAGAGVALTYREYQGHHELTAEMVADIARWLDGVVHE